MTNPEVISQWERRKYRESLKRNGEEFRNQENNNINDKDEFTEELLKQSENLQEQLKAEQERARVQQSTIEELNWSINEIQTSLDWIQNNLNSLNLSGNNTNNQTTPETNPSDQTTPETNPSDQTPPETNPSDQTTPETNPSDQTTPETNPSDQTTPETNPSDQAENQQDIRLDSYEWFTTALSQLIFEMEWCKQTAKYKKWLNESWKETLKTAEAKINQFKSIVEGKLKAIKNELKEKNKLNKKNPDKAPLTLSITRAEINELKNVRYQWRRLVEIDIKEWQNWKSSNIAPWPNQSLDQIKKAIKVDKHHKEYDSKLNEALHDTAFLRIIDNNQDNAREFLQAIANNSLTDNQIAFCQLHMNQLAPYFEQYGMLTQVHTCIQTRWWRYNQNIQYYNNVDYNTIYRTRWVPGVLSKFLTDTFSNVKPQTATSIANIATLGAWICAAYWLWKRFFKKDKDWKRHLLTNSARIIWWWLVLPEILFWQNWFSLLWDILSWRADFSELWYRLSNCLWWIKNNSPELYNAMTPGILWMNILPIDYTVTDVRILIKELSTDPNKHKQRYTDTYNRLKKNDYMLAHEFQNSFNADKCDENERKAFLEKLWITDETSWDVKMFDKMKDSADKNTSLYYWVKFNWKIINPKYKEEIDNYIKQEWEFDPEKLNPNWFIDNNNEKNKPKEATEETTKEQTIQ